MAIITKTATATVASSQGLASAVPSELERSRVAPLVSRDTERLKVTSTGANSKATFADPSVETYLHAKQAGLLSDANAARLGKEPDVHIGSLEKAALSLRKTYALDA